MQTLMQQYTAYNDRLKARGVQFLTFQCPACSSAIEVQQPGLGEKWDTLASCPHCEVMFMEVATHTQAFGYMPPARTEGAPQ